MLEWSVLLSSVAEILRALQWPLVAMIVGVFLGPEIKTLLHRMKSWKALGIEGEFSEAVQQLTESATEAAASESASPPLRVSVSESQGVHTSGHKKDSSNETIRKNQESLKRVVELSSQGAECSILQMWEVINSKIVSHAERLSEHLSINHEVPLTPDTSKRLLVAPGVMTPSLAKSISDFREVRNKVAHARHNEDDLQLALISGLAILNLVDQMHIPA